MAKIKKIPMRLVVSVMAVLLLAVAVPISVAVADSMNGMIGGGDKRIWELKDQDGLTDKTALVGGLWNGAYSAQLLALHKSSAGSVMIDKQVFFDRGVTGKNNTVVVSYADTTQDAVRDTNLVFNTILNPRIIMNEGIEEIRLTLSSTTPKALFVKEGTLQESTNGRVLGGLVFWGLKDAKMTSYMIPISVESEPGAGHYDSVKKGYVLNLTATANTYTIRFGSNDILRAVTALDGSTAVSTALCITSFGSTDATSIVNGDMFEFSISAFGSPVNGFALSDGVVGILGVCLIVGAVFATPWVGRGTFDKASQWNRDRKSRKATGKRTRRGRR